MRIAITGSSGLIGQAIVEFFEAREASVTRVARLSITKTKPSEQHMFWDLSTKKIDSEGLEGQDGIIHLAGENIADQRWDDDFKEKIRSSRIEGTTFLSETIAKLEFPPKVFISASAVGFYGNHEPQIPIDEESKVGEDFLAKLCQDWEASTQAAKQAGVRVVHFRTGAVLSPKGGALAKMLPIFQMALGGKLGSGKQMMSWVALDEIPKIVLHIIENEDIKGPVNIVSPEPVSNQEFSNTLGEVINRPTKLPAPAFALRLLVGEMADYLLLGGARVLPKRLQEGGYQFQYPHLKEALESCLAGLDEEE